MKDTNSRTLRTFFDDCALTLRYVGGTAHFELWIPGEADPEPLATLPAAGGAISWAPTARDLLEHYDEEKEEMIPVAYAEDIRAILEDFAALAGDPQLLLERYVGFDEDDDDDDEEDDENKPLVIARDEEQLDY